MGGKVYINNMDPKVSIIIPVYNVGKYLDTCLSSAENQTLEDIEIICIEDSSTDNSRKILLEHAEKDCRIVTVFHETNKGIYLSTRDGVLASRGEYIMYLDSDDEYFPETCEKAVASIEKAGTDILEFGTVLTKEGSIPESVIKWFETWLTPPSELIEGNTSILNRSLRDMDISWNTWNKIYKGDIARKAAGRSAEERIYNISDICTFFFNAFFSNSLCGIPDRLYKYRIGIGVSWNKAKTLESYTRSVNSKVVAEIFNRFLSDKPERELLSGAVNAVARRQLEGCIGDYMVHGLNSDWREDGLRVLLDTYGGEAAPLLADRIYEIKKSANKYKAEAEENRKEIDNILNSKTYRFGNTIAKPYRQIKTFMGSKKNG